MTNRFGENVDPDTYLSIANKLYSFYSELREDERNLIISLFIARLEPLERYRILGTNLMQDTELEYLSTLENNMEEKL